MSIYTIFQKSRDLTNSLLTWGFEDQGIKHNMVDVGNTQPGFLQNFNEVEFDPIYSDRKAANVVFRRKRIDFDNSGSKQFQIYHPHIRTAAQANQRRVGTSTAQLQRATHLNHLRSYDFLEARTEPGGWLQILAVLDEYTRQCLAIEVERSFPAQKVLDLLEWLF